MAKPNPQAFHERVAETLIEQLKQGTAPWLKPWQPGSSSLPHNPVSGTRYRGINTVWLTMQGQADPRWMTYKQAASAGAQVRKGEKGTTVQYWTFDELKVQRDEAGQPVLGNDGKPLKVRVVLERPKVFYSTVFNAAQIEGLAEREIKEPAWDRHERAEHIFANSGIEHYNDQGDSAFYRPHTDSIHTPHESAFETADKYYATLLHELGHATGHASRLDRDLSHPFGTEGYAKEELRAEIASLMLGDELGIGHDPGQHTAYVASWIQILEDEPKEIRYACRDAEAIMRWVMDLEQQRERTPERAEPEADAQLETAPPAIDDEAAARGARQARETWRVSQPLRDELTLGPWPLSVHNVRAENWATVVVPLHDADGQIWSLERLNSRSGTSLGYEPNTRRDGCFFVVGTGDIKPLERSEAALAHPLYVASEFKTAAALWAATGNAVVVSFGVENMAVVADTLQARLPDAALVLVAEVERGEPNAIVQNTARELGARVVAPDLTPEERDVGYTSFYDVYGLHGWEAVQTQVSAQLQQQTQEAGRDVQDGPTEPDAPELGLAEAQTLLNVPYREKDAAKALGAKWDPAAKSWYAPEGTDLTPLTRWVPEASLDHPALELEPIVSFGAALLQCGLQLEGLPEMDGHWRRLPVEGGQPGNRDGAYVGYLDGRPAGYIKNHKTGMEVKWKAGERALQNLPSLSDEGRTRMRTEAGQNRERRDAERQAGYGQQAQALQARWAQLTPADHSHRYLETKDVSAYGLMQNEHGSLLIPLRDVDGKLWSAQSINEIGHKQFAPGCRKRGAFHTIGERKPSEPILIAEGYATAASIHAATGRPVVVAFDASNLKPVAEVLRAQHPQAPILICGDNDHHLGSGEKNVGRSKAKEAAQAVEGRAMFPVFTPAELRESASTDFNDLHQSRGLEAVQRQVEAGVSRLPTLAREPARQQPEPERSRESAGLTI